MKWVMGNTKIPIKSWCLNIEQGALAQAIALSQHPVIVKHVALMADSHQGVGCPIGSVTACENALIIMNVGVDVGCGMNAVETNIPADTVDESTIRDIMQSTKRGVPVGFAVHSNKNEWLRKEIGKPDSQMFDLIFENAPWSTPTVEDRVRKSLGTLGGGNHFIELQKSDDGFIWLMLHSGSRNLGKTVADYYHKKAIEFNEKWKSDIPNKDLAFLPADDPIGKEYIKYMNYCLEFAKENRRLMMEVFKSAIWHIFKKNQIDVNFVREINIHHNFAQLEHHFGRDYWIHRKGATQARAGQLGIIPGSMGTPSYIVEGLGNPESFESCSHGAGRRMGRSDASRTLSKEDCDEAMKGIVFEGFGKPDRGKTEFDLGEAPQAYKDIEDVIESQLDLIKPIKKLYPLGVIKG